MFVNKIEAMKNTPRKTIKKEVEQENVEVQAARGRLKGLLNNIIMEPEGAAAGADTPPKSKSNRGRPKRIRDRDVGAPGGKPYIIKLFDRMVNVSEFDDSTPLYPITRAWFYDRKNEQLAPQKPTDADLQPTYYKGRESLVRALTSGRIDRVAALPPPNEDEDVQRIPFCEPPSMDNGLNAFTADYVGCCDSYCRLHFVNC